MVLAFYLTAASVHGLLARSVAGHSLAGIGVLAATVLAMLILARAKRGVGLDLRSHPLLANATMTLLDGALAAGVLVALLLDLIIGW